MGLQPSLRSFMRATLPWFCEMAPIDPSLRIAAVQLAVADLPASVDFYSRVMGSQVLENDGRGRCSARAANRRSS